MNAILVKAIEKGFNAKELFAKGYSVEDVVIEAEDYIIENTPKAEWKFEHCELSRGYSQNYTYKSKVVSGEVFDFADYKADREVYFREEKGVFTAISKWDIPEEDERGEDVWYIFVYDTIIDEDTAEVVRLYDYM
ncbi:MAG: hypothetical protein U0L38_04655 [Bacteroidales bacterium]|nr:hypothetical protein [Bacteroidales bacterium]